MDFKPIPKGKYIFEVIKVEQGVSNGEKTKGCPNLKLTLLLMDKDMNKVGQFTDRKNTLIFEHEKLEYRIDTFTTCTGMASEVGTELEYGEETMVGLRGWCEVGAEPSQNDPTKIYNHVERWLTNEAKIPRNVPQEDEPF